MGAISFTLMFTLWLLGRLTLSGLLASPAGWLAFLVVMLMVSLALAKVLWEGAGILAVVLPSCLVLLILVKLFPAPTMQRWIIVAMPVLSVLLAIGAVPIAIIGIVQRQAASGQMGSAAESIVAMLLGALSVGWIYSPFYDKPELLRQAAYREIFDEVSGAIGEFVEKHERLPKDFAELTKETRLNRDRLLDPITEKPPGRLGEGGLVFVRGVQLAHPGENILVYTDHKYAAEQLPRRKRYLGRVYGLSKSLNFWALDQADFDKQLTATRKTLKPPP
jgi:hypothetical protein